MHTVTVTEFKKHLGQYMDSLLQNPVFIKKSGREKAVLLSSERYAELQSLEDRYWLELADEAEKSGLAGSEETMSVLKRGLADEQKEIYDRHNK